MGNVNSIHFKENGKYRIDSISCCLDNCKLKTKELVTYVESLVESYPLTQNLTIKECKLKEVPANITKLSYLVELSLCDNKLSSLPWSLPPPILQANNRMSMMISISSVVNENLVKLDLTGNHFSEFPSSVFVLPNLKILILNNNQLTDINVQMCGGASINNGTNKPFISCKLEQLKLSDNEFSQFPAIITELTTLKLLDISGNSLSTLPSSFSQLSSLTSLNLKSNKFTSFPASICTLDHLQNLNLAHNQICINSSHHTLGVSLLPSLEKLELQHNRFGEFPQDILELKSLKVLKLQDNDIEIVPDKIGHLVHLTELFLSENKIESLPASIGQCINLKKLYLEYNKIQSLPTDFSKLTKLNILILHNNELKNVPQELNQLSQLLRLSLDENPLPSQDLKLIKSEGSLSLIKHKSNYNGSTVNGGTIGTGRGSISSSGNDSINGSLSKSSVMNMTPDLSGTTSISAAINKFNKKKHNHLTISRSLFRGNSSNLENEKDDFHKQKQIQNSIAAAANAASSCNSSTSSPITSHITVNSTVLDFEDDIQKMSLGEFASLEGAGAKQRRGSVFLPPTNAFKLSPPVVSSSYNTLPASLGNILQQDINNNNNNINHHNTFNGTTTSVGNSPALTHSLLRTTSSISNSNSFSSPQLLSHSMSQFNLAGNVTPSSSTTSTPSSINNNNNNNNNINNSSNSVTNNNTTTTTTFSSKSEPSSTNPSPFNSNDSIITTIPSFSKFKNSFDQLLEEQDFSKKKRESLQKLSKEQKWNLLLQYRNSTLKMLNLVGGQPLKTSSGSSTPINLSTSGGNVTPPSLTTSSPTTQQTITKNSHFQPARFYIDNLSIKTDISLIKEIHDFLKEGGPEVSLFIGFHGIESFVTILQYNLDHATEQFDEEKVGYCLLCMKILIEYTARSVITTHNSINMISMFLSSNSKYIIDIIIDIFDEILRLPTIGTSIVLDSLINFQKVKGLSSPYVPLVALLKSSTIDLSTKTTIFKIINFLIYSFTVLEERFSVICSLLKVGILEVISNLRLTSNKQDILRFELDLFEEVLDSDESELVKKIGRKEVLKRMSNEDNDLSKQSKESNDFVRVVMVSAGYGDLKIDLNEKTSYSDVIQFIQSNYQIKYDIDRYGLFVPAIGGDNILQSSGQQSRWVDPTKTLLENGLNNEIVEFKMKPIQVNILQNNITNETKIFTIDPQLKCFEIVHQIRTNLDSTSPAFQRKLSTLIDDEEEDYESDIYGVYCFGNLESYAKGTWYPLNSRFLDFNPNNDPMIIEIKLMERPLRISFSGTEKVIKFSPYVPVSVIMNEIKNEIHLKINIEDYGISYIPNTSQSNLSQSITEESWLDPNKTLLDHFDMKCSIVQFKFKPRSVNVNINIESGIATNDGNVEGPTQESYLNTLSISEIIEKICTKYQLNPLNYSLYLSNKDNQKIKLLSRQNCLRDQSINNGDYLILTSKQKDLPSDFNVWDEPGDNPDNITFTKDSKISSITLNKLIERLTNPDSQESDIKSIFLSTYRSVITPITLLNKLLERHTIPTAIVDKEKGKLIQRKTRLLIKSWLEIETPNNREQVIDLLRLHMPTDSIEDDGHKELRELYLDLTTKIYPSIIQIPNGDLPKPKIPKSDSSLLVSFLDMDEMEIARQLSLLTFPLYSKIETSELLNQRWAKPNGGPGVMAVVGLFNKISNWVSFTILNQPKLRDRAFVFGKMVKIASAFHDLQNYHLLMAVISGLNSSPILRLKFTKSKLSKSIRETLDNLEELMSTQSSMKNYRAELANAQPPAIPFMGFHLSDLVFIDEGNQAMYDNKINFKKLELYKKTISVLQNYTLFPYQFHPVPIIQQYFLDYKIVSEKPLYEISLRCEPRNSQASDIE